MIRQIGTNGVTDEGHGDTLDKIETDGQTDQWTCRQTDIPTDKRINYKQTDIQAKDRKV